MAIITRAQRTITSELRSVEPPPRLFLVLAFALALLLGATILLEAAFAGRALPGLRVAGVDVGGLDAAAVQARLEARLAGPWAAAEVRATHEGRAFVTTNGSLGLVPDTARAAANAVGFGWQGAPLARLEAWVDSIAGRASLALSVAAEGDAASSWTSRVAAQVERPAVAGEIRRTPAGIQIVEPVVGVSIDRDAFLAALVEPGALGDREIAVPARSLVPAVDEEGIRDAARLVRAVTTPLELTAGDRSLSEDPIGLASFVRFERTPAEAAAEAPARAVVPERRWRYVASIDEGAVRAWAANVAAALDRPAQSAGYRVGLAGAYEVVPGAEGVLVHQDLLVTIALEELARPAEERRVMAVPVTTKEPRFTTQRAEGYLAQLTPVGTFTTAYPVNRARHTNIRIGAALFDGVVVAPGEALSFWSVFGPEPAAKGFVPAGAIIDGISDDSVVGGGLCQVSTTLFNAVLRGGYEIVERYQHSYLIERYPIGLDAAVFFPGADMVWRNDTPYPVLIRSSATPTSVSFTLVSVPNDRTVAFSSAVQSNWRPVTAELVPDPGHAPGYKVDGRDVVRVRTVTEGGQTIHRDVFWSRYIPVWGGPAR